MDTVSEADRKSNPGCFWKLLKGLSGEKVNPAPPIQPIAFNGNIFTCQKQIAKQFCQLYANPVPFKASKESRAIYRDLKLENPLDRSFSLFTTASVAEAIKRTKNSTAAGPNGITALHLKHLGPNGLRYLTRLYTASICDADVPVIWRSANIVPLPKPNKPGLVIVR